MRLHRSLNPKSPDPKNLIFGLGSWDKGTIEVSKSHVTDLNEFTSY